MHDCLTKKGPAEVKSIKGTVYSVGTAITQKGERIGEKVIIARPAMGQVRIHEDCWGNDITCQETALMFYTTAGTVNIQSLSPKLIFDLKSIKNGQF